MLLQALDKMFETVIVLEGDAAQFLKIDKQPDFIKF